MKRRNLSNVLFVTIVSLKRMGEVHEGNNVTFVTSSVIEKLEITFISSS